MQTRLWRLNEPLFMGRFQQYKHAFHDIVSVSEECSNACRSQAYRIEIFLPCACACFKSGNLLKLQAYAYCHLAGAELERHLREEIAQLTPVQPGARSNASDALALVPFEEMDRSVAFGAISRPFEAACADQSGTLNVRLGYALARGTLCSGQNSFRPETILLALNQAWREF